MAVALGVLKWVRGRKSEPDWVVRRPKSPGRYVCAVHKRADGTYAWHAWSPDGKRKLFGLAPSEHKAKVAANRARAELV